MTIKTEGVHAGEFLHSEANGTRSRADVVISAGAGRLAAGTLLALITAANAATATPAAGNTGDGTVTGLTATSAASSGDYVVTIDEVEEGAAAFTVLSADERQIGTGVVGEPFEAGGLSFTLAAGSTAFAEGDSFVLSVLANLGEYVAYDNSGTDDGRRTASAILWAPVDATEVDVRAAAVVRDAEVIARLLTGLDAEGEADLAALGIVVRD